MAGSRADIAPIGRHGPPQLHICHACPHSTVQWPEAPCTVAYWRLQTPLESISHRLEGVQSTSVQEVKAVGKSP